MSEPTAQIRPNVAFRRLARTLADELRSGKWLPGQTMPSRRDLAKNYDVTPNTVNKAIHELVAQGLVTTSERHGTKVAGQSALTPMQTAANVRPPAANLGGTIGIIATSPDDPVAWMLSDTARTDLWLGTIARSIEVTLAAGCVRLRYFRVWGDAYPTPAAAIEAALANKVEGLIVTNVYGFPGYEEALSARTDLQRLPTLLLTSVAMSSPFSQLSYDQAQFGYVAARHLTDATYQRIVVLRLCAAEWFEDRIRGAERAVRAAGLPYRFEVVTPPNLLTGQQVQELEPLALSELAGQLYDQAGIVGNGSTAVIMPSDRMALALVTVLSNRGILPGRDVGLIGFDDTLQGRVAGLTTVRPPLETMGTTAAQRIMLAMTEGPRVVQETIPPLLLPRGSTNRTRIA